MIAEIDIKLLTTNTSIIESRGLKYSKCVLKMRKRRSRFNTVDDAAPTTATGAEPAKPRKRSRFGTADPAAAKPAAAAKSDAQKEKQRKLAARKAKLAQWKAKQAAGAAPVAVEAAAPLSSSAALSGARIGIAIKGRRRPQGAPKQSPVLAGVFDVAPRVANAFEAPSLTSDEPTAAAARVGAIDPLEAFMASLHEEHGSVVAQNSAAAASSAAAPVAAAALSAASAAAPSTRAAAAAPPITTISLDDILSGNVDVGGGAEESGRSGGAAAAPSAEEEDALYAEFQAQLAADKKATRAANDAAEKQRKLEAGLGVDFEGDNDLTERFAVQMGKGKSALDILREKMKKKSLKVVRHSEMQYAPFRKDFYTEAPSVAAMPQARVDAIRKKAHCKIRGRKCPRPFIDWRQAGLSAKVMHVIEKQGFATPFAIQQQAIPCIMSGRDCIGVAKTGSGKTLAFLLPMFRHVCDQPPLGEGEGPIALILAPSRELTVQIYTEAKKFAKVLNLRVAAVYGGAPVAEQIAELKRGSEIVVACPGRLIDILTMNAGRVISMSRVTCVRAPHDAVPSSSLSLAILPDSRALAPPSRRSPPSTYSYISAGTSCWMKQTECLIWASSRRSL
jgi:ATP-dependent RNA helicase DDX46/PRP5